MRSLKNWTITAESLKNGRDGFLSYYQYLKSQSGKHKNQTIQELTNKNSAINIIRVADGFNLSRKLKKGGRPSNYGWSATFSYPFEIDTITMKLLFESNMRKLLNYVSDFNKLKLTEDAINKLIHEETVAILHSGFKTNGQPINNHLHTIIPKHFRAQHGARLVSVDLTHKRYLKALKAINDANVYEILGMSVLDHQIKIKTEQKKRKTATEYSFEKVAQQVDEAQVLLDEINVHIVRYKQWANETQSHDEEVPKELNRAIVQLRNGNTIRAKKTLDNFKNKYRGPKI
ncbi:MAG: hypothetical protein Q8M43_06500 [Sulfuricurvum sp.]|nr:hypothetical protein [Sulfuricurvum sp.]